MSSLARRCLPLAAYWLTFQALVVLGHSRFAGALHLEWLGSTEPAFLGCWALLSVALICAGLRVKPAWHLTWLLALDTGVIALGWLGPDNPLFFGTWLALNAILWRRARRAPARNLAPELLVCLVVLGARLQGLGASAPPYGGGWLELTLLLGTLLMAGWTARSSWAGSLPGVHRGLLAPGLWILWLTCVQVGSWSGSFLVAVALGAAAVGGVAAKAYRAAGPGLTARPLLGTVDLLLLAVLSAGFLAVNGFDTECHHAITSTYLRGNLPAAALNDPRYPLVYHAVFDLAAAIVARSTHPAHLEHALDAVSLLSLVATFHGLHALSRLLFRDRWARVASRAFFVFGFGPIYVFPLLASEPLYTVCHGATTQAFLDASLRRPMGINFTVYLFLLGLFLPRLGRGPEEAAAPPPALLALPVLFVLPQLSEELAGFSGLLLLLIAIRRGLSWRWLAALGAALLAGMACSPVLVSSAGAASSMAVPQPVLAWPPTLPCWYNEHQRPGLPLFSLRGAWTLACELGPLFALGLVLGWRRPRGRALVALFAAGLLAAAFVRLDGWIKADLDRFLFYGTATGFFLCAGLVERLSPRARDGDRKAAAAIVALAVGIMAGPVSYAAIQMQWLRYGLPEPKERGHPLALQHAFTAVGPRDQVATPSLRFARELVEAGFLVSAPMNSNAIGLIDPSSFPAHVADPPRDPEWLALPAGDPRLAGRPVVARFRVLGTWLHEQRPTGYDLLPYEETTFDVVLIRNEP